MAELSAPDKTKAIFTDVALKPVVAVAIVKQLHISRRAFVESVFKRYIIKESVFAAGNICTR